MSDELANELCLLYENAALCADQAAREMSAAQPDRSGLDLIFQRKLELATSIAAREKDLIPASGISALSSEQKIQLRLAQERALRSENRLAEVLNNRASAAQNGRSFPETEQKQSGKKLDISN